MIPDRVGVCDVSRSALPRTFRGQARKGRRVTAGPLISVIDDDNSMRSAVLALVRSAGYEARSFASAEDFLDSADAQGSACVITDIQMPGMDGIELKQHLMASRNAVPVIMITARHEADLEEKALASGAAFFLRKPFDADLLIECIESSLKP